VIHCPRIIAQAAALPPHTRRQRLHPGPGRRCV